MAAEDRRDRDEQIKEALDPRPRIDRYAREALAAISKPERALVPGGV
jgi:hypothetical protein